LLVLKNIRHSPRELTRAAERKRGEILKDEAHRTQEKGREEINSWTSTLSLVKGSRQALSENRGGRVTEKKTGPRRPSQRYIPPSS